ncbi:hypothetical protein CRG98_026227 [Punica granatum]|uniref:Uncharacterized protein n=1 Tax=Punica granatum TaxID=22663 RepID=A0A2I0JAW0_PUNGR|nr:hypothetical protein CRG98_026227 [Punica granatum]
MGHANETRTRTGHPFPSIDQERPIKTVKPDKKGEVKRRLCAVVGLSDRDHLFTGESEGCEEPLEHDGTTGQSRGRKRHVGGCAHPNLISSGHACTMPMQRDLGVSTFPGTCDGHA